MFTIICQKRVYATCYQKISKLMNRVKPERQQYQALERERSETILPLCKTVSFLLKHSVYVCQVMHVVYILSYVDVCTYMGWCGCMCMHIV